MKSTGIITMILALFLASCTSEPAVVEPTLPSKEEAKSAIMEKIEMAADKWASSDPFGYLEAAAPDITWSDDLNAPVPVIGKEALSAYLEPFKGQIPVHSYELSKFHFQFYEDIVIITYHYQGTLEEMKMNPWKVSSVYRYADEDWLSVHENWTRVKKKEEAAD